jgi:RNA polymerase sigma factor for flagellar operon FliA
MLDIDNELPADGGELPEELAGRKEIHEAVAEAIHTLPERLQHVLALYYTEECTLREIGAILEVSESRVCQLHTEAVHRLRAAIGRE